VAPQFEHSALTPPGALLPLDPVGGSVVGGLATVAPGSEGRVVAEKAGMNQVW
jgi:hypothetical protein